MSLKFTKTRKTADNEVPWKADTEDSLNMMTVHNMGNTALMRSHDKVESQ